MTTKGAQGRRHPVLKAALAAVLSAPSTAYPPGSSEVRRAPARRCRQKAGHRGHGRRLTARKGPFSARSTPGHQPTVAPSTQSFPTRGKGSGEGRKGRPCALGRPPIGCSSYALGPDWLRAERTGRARSQRRSAGGGGGAANGNGRWGGAAGASVLTRASW